jgi:hypothetical protein
MEEEGKPFSYTVVCPDSVTTQFLYAQNDDGTTSVSLFGLSYQDGRWLGPDDASYSFAQFGGCGTKLTVIGSIGGSIIQMPNYVLELAFGTAVELTKPLPLGSLSLPDCSYSIEFDLPPPVESSHYPVERVQANSGG